MLKIINDIKPFIDDNYRRINVREYARIQKISPPSASKLLENLKKEALLIKEKEKNYIYYAANKESRIFVDFSRIYWLKKIRASGCIEAIEKEYLNPIIILFGSLSKAEARKESDIDIAIFSVTKKRIDLARYEKKLGRKIQTFLFKNKEEIKSRELLNNILNGYILSGSW